jgi:hypothetical protein
MHLWSLRTTSACAEGRVGKGEKTPDRPAEGAAGVARTCNTTL